MQGNKESPTVSCHTVYASCAHRNECIQTTDGKVPLKLSQVYFLEELHSVPFHTSLRLTSDVRPQRLVIFLEQVVEDERGVLLVRPGHQHLIDVGVVVILVVVAIFQQITAGKREKREGVRGVCVCWGSS